jgi:hypothetical protein
MEPARRRSVGVALAALAAAVLAAVGAAALVALIGEESEPAPAVASAPSPLRPGTLIEQVYGRLHGGQYGRAWDLLHPAHQAIVSRARYIACAADWPQTPGLARFEVLRVYDDPIDVPLVPQRTSKAVTYRVTLTAGGLRDSFTSTGHAVDVAGRWRWVLAGPDIETFLDGQCPA